VAAVDKLRIILVFKIQEYKKLKYQQGIQEYRRLKDEKNNPVVFKIAQQIFENKQKNNKFGQTVKVDRPDLVSRKDSFRRNQKSR
jgi:hypothetical protein